MIAAEEVDLFYGSDGPTVQQKKGSDAKETYKLLGGALGGGKSYWLSAEGARLSWMFPGNRGFMCRDEAKAFKNTTLITLLSVISNIEKCTGTRFLEGHNKSEEKIRFRNGSEIIYGGLGGRENHDRVKSLEIGWYAVDEASECNERDIDMLESRLRWRLPNGQFPKFFGLYASNPEPGWLKTRFVIPQQRGNKHDERIFVQALPRDNKWLPQGYIDRISQGKPDYWVKRYIGGSWDAAEGQIWPQFDHDIHVFPNSWSNFEVPIPERLDQYPTIFASYDHGIVDPACFLGWYTGTDGTLYVFNEYYGPGLISHHCREINSIFNIKLFHYMQADPQIWSTVGERGGQKWSLSSEYEDNGFVFTPASNAVHAGINRVGEYLYVDPKRKHPITGKMGAPNVIISARCSNLTREIPEYIWKTATKADSDREKPRKAKDHGPDTFRYGIASRPSIDTRVIERDKPGTFGWYRDKQTFRTRRGLWAVN